MTTREILLKANAVKAEMAQLGGERKNLALSAMADEINKAISAILSANEKDVEEAKGKISPVMLDRLALDSGRVKAMAEGLKAVAALPDPVGEVLDERTRADGLNIRKVSVPFGVVAVIYESRPNVTSDVAALCLKSGNVCVLRCGKEAHRTAGAIVLAMKRGLANVGICEDAVNLVEDLSRGSAKELMEAEGLVDLLIPRGGAGLIKACVDGAKVPCIETGTGICHVYVDKSADFKKALDIIENAKCSRPSVCNAMEVCLVDKAVSKEFLPLLWQRLVQKRDKNKVCLLCDNECFPVLEGKENCFAAKEGDFDTEFLDYKMAVAEVDGVEGAASHIARHSTHHSEAIIAEDFSAANKFTVLVDSAAVYVNASTRFTDGGEFGLGCEIGISTQKLHARGPMGLKELTTYKYIVTGTGNIR